MNIHVVSGSTESRRRRPTRRAPGRPAGWLRFAVPIGCAAAVLSGCSSQEPEGDSTAEPVVRTVSVRPDPATLRLPLDDFRATDRQSGQLAAAFRLALRQCVAEFGLSYDPPAPPAQAAPLGKNARRYGVTDDAGVSVHGFRMPPGVAVTKEPAQELSPELETVLSGKGPRTVAGRPVPAGGCATSAHARIEGRSQVEDNLPDRLSAESLSRSQADSRVRAALGQWSACMRERGFDYSIPENAVADPRFSQGEVTALEISTARADVACKRRTNLVGVWSSVDAAYQTRLIEQNREALDAVRSAREERLQVASRLVAQP